MAPETGRQPEKDIKDRKPVQADQGRGLKAARCRYIDVFRKEALQITTQKISLQLM